LVAGEEETSAGWTGSEDATVSATAGGAAEGYSTELGAPSELAELLEEPIEIIRIARIELLAPAGGSGVSSTAMRGALPRAGGGALLRVAAGCSGSVFTKAGGVGCGSLALPLMLAIVGRVAGAGITTEASGSLSVEYERMESRCLGLGGGAKRRSD